MSLATVPPCVHALAVLLMASCGFRFTSATIACDPVCVGTCVAGICLHASVFAPRPLLSQAVMDVAPLKGYNSALQTFPALPLAPALRGSSAGLPYFDDRVLQDLQVELAKVRADSERTQAVNTQLGHELNVWRGVGAEITAHQQQTTALIQLQQELAASVGPSHAAARLHPPTEGAQPGSSEVSLVSLLPGEVAAAENKFHLRLQRMAPWQFVAVCASLAVFAVVGAYSVTRSLGAQCFSKASPYRSHNLSARIRSGSVHSTADGLSWDWRAVATQFLTLGGRRMTLLPTLRRLGFAHYSVEIREIHLGGLVVPGEEVFLRLCTPQGQELRTQAVKSAQGNPFARFSRFSDSFVVSTRTSDGAFFLSATSSCGTGGELARLELAASRLVDLALRPHGQEYFRAEMQLSDCGGSLTQKPYVAMRIRDVTLYASPGDTAEAVD